MFFVDFTVADLMTLAGHAFVWTAFWAALEGRIELALAFLILAMLLDALDGKVARALGIARPFGRYLGSFVDLLDYTVVPPLLLHRMGYDAWWNMVVLFLFSTAGLLRLSKFNEVGNIRQDGRLAYLGLPVFWTHFLLMVLYGVHRIDPGPGFTVATTAGLAFLAPCFLMDRPFPKPQNYALILVVTLTAAATFLALAS